MNGVWVTRDKISAIAPAIISGGQGHSACGTNDGIKYNHRALPPTKMTLILLLGLLLVTPLLAIAPLHPDCFISGPGPPAGVSTQVKENRTKVELGYLTAVTGTMNNRQVTPALQCH